MHAPLQRFSLPAPGVHAPLQQSAGAPQSEPIARHAPAPWSQRLFTHVAQQDAPPPELQSSAVARQPAVVSSAHFLSPPQTPEQHVSALTQSSPSREHSVCPHTPPLQPSEQQSCARVHVSPSRLQNSRHRLAAALGTGSHEPLQQSARETQTAPGIMHAPFGMHAPDSQRPEQHSPASEQVSPTP